MGMNTMHTLKMNTQLADTYDHMPFTPVSRAAAFPALAPQQPHTDVDFYTQFAKRPLDILLVLISLPFSLPLIALMACMVALGGGNPFYRQQRLGMGGRVYSMWKLRTMVRDADAQMLSYLEKNPAAKAEWDETQKLRHDPRITPIGRILRKTSLDELPQIINVLRGEMSLIGPRPMMVCQESLYDNESYYDLRPGITGLWQVSRRNEASFFERAQIDAKYARRLSFGTDLRILLDTFRVVVSGTGC